MDIVKDQQHLVDRIGDVAQQLSKCSAMVADNYCDFEAAWRQWEQYGTLHGVGNPTMEECADDALWQLMANQCAFVNCLGEFYAELKAIIERPLPSLAEVEAEVAHEARATS